MLTLPDTNEDQKVFGSPLLFVGSAMLHQRQRCCEHEPSHMIVFSVSAPGPGCHLQMRPPIHQNHRWWHQHSFPIHWDAPFLSHPASDRINLNQCILVQSQQSETTKFTYFAQSSSTSLSYIVTKGCGNFPLGTFHPSTLPPFLGAVWSRR